MDRFCRGHSRTAHDQLGLKDLSRLRSFAAKELALIRKYNGRIVHTELANFDGKSKQPVVVIYSVHK